MNPFARLGIAVGVALGIAVLLAIVLAVLDLYLTGHGLASITAETITEPAWGVHLSIADAVLLVVAASAAVLTWWLLPRRR